MNSTSHWANQWPQDAEEEQRKKTNPSRCEDPPPVLSPSREWRHSSFSPHLRPSADTPSRPPCERMSCSFDYAEPVLPLSRVHCWMQLLCLEGLHPWVDLPLVFHPHCQHIPTGYSKQGTSTNPPPGLIHIPRLTFYCHALGGLGCLPSYLKGSTFFPIRLLLFARTVLSLLKNPWESKTECWGRIGACLCLGSPRSRPLRQ